MLLQYWFHISENLRIVTDQTLQKLQEKHKNNFIHEKIEIPAMSKGLKP